MRNFKVLFLIIVIVFISQNVWSSEYKYMDRAKCKGMKSDIVSTKSEWHNKYYPQIADLVRYIAVQTFLYEKRNYEYENGKNFSARMSLSDIYEVYEARFEYKKQFISVYVQNATEKINSDVDKLTITISDKKGKFAVTDWGLLGAVGSRKERKKYTQILLKISDYYEQWNKEMDVKERRKIAQQKKEKAKLLALNKKQEEIEEKLNEIEDKTYECTSSLSLDSKKDSYSSNKLSKVEFFFYIIFPVSIFSACLVALFGYIYDRIIEEWKKKKKKTTKTRPKKVMNKSKPKTKTTFKIKKKKKKL